MIRSACIMWFPTDSVLWSPWKTWRPTWWRREARSQWVTALAILTTFGASLQKPFKYSFFKSGVWCDKYHKRAKRFNSVVWEGECVQGNIVKLGTVIFFLLVIWKLILKCRSQKWHSVAISQCNDAECGVFIQDWTDCLGPCIPIRCSLWSPCVTTPKSLLLILWYAFDTARKTWMWLNVQVKPIFY